MANGQSPPDDEIVELHSGEIEPDTDPRARPQQPAVAGRTPAPSPAARLVGPPRHEAPMAPQPTTVDPHAIEGMEAPDTERHRKPPVGPPMGAPGGPPLGMAPAGPGLVPPPPPHMAPRPGMSPQASAPPGVPAQAMPPQGMAPQGMPPRGMAPQGMAPPNVAPQGHGMPPGAPAGVPQVAPVPLAPHVAAAPGIPAPSPQAQQVATARGNPAAAMVGGTLGGSAEVLTSAPPEAALGGYEYTPPGDEAPLEGAPTRIETAAQLGLEQDGQAPEPRPTFEVIGGNDRGREFTLGRGDHSIGRGLDNQIVLADIAVSRKHTLICEENGLFVLRDLGSGNGTLVNGEKVHKHHLKDGDQVELGNTLMRFRIPFQLGEAATVAGKLQPAGGGVTPMVAPAPAGQYSPQTPVEPAGTAVRPLDEGKAKRGMSSRQKLLIFGGGGVFLLLAIAFAVKVAVHKKPPPPTPTPKVNATQEARKHYRLGMQFATKREWEKARKHCQRVDALAPGWDGAKTCAKRATEELDAQKALEAAKKALAAKDFEAARGQLAKISANSVYTVDARKTKQRVDDQQVELLIAESTALKEKQDRQGALAKIKEAHKIAPTNQVVKRLYGELSDKGGSGTNTKVTPPQTPRRTPRVGRTPRPRTAVRVGGGPNIRRALAAYRRRDFAGAQGALAAQVRKAKGRSKTRALQLAKAAKHVQMAWARGDQLQSRNPGQALRAYQAAIKYDRQIPGAPHAKALRTKLTQVARIYANASLAARRWAVAYSAVRIARSNGASPAQLRGILTKLEAKAKALFESGYTMRTSNPRKARQLWKQVLRMVPSSSSAYQKAYKWLNVRAGGYQDEDED